MSNNKTVADITELLNDFFYYLIEVINRVLYFFNRDPIDINKGTDEEG